ncbi:MAG: hypothetical protein RL017_740, partial [Pseudomonadota bacterium]
MPQFPATLMVELFCPNETREVKAINKNDNNKFFIK